MIYSKRIQVVIFSFLLLNIIFGLKDGLPEIGGQFLFEDNVVLINKHDECCLVKDLKQGQNIAVYDNIKQNSLGSTKITEIKKRKT